MWNPSDDFARSATSDHAFGPYERHVLRRMVLSYLVSKRGIRLRLGEGFQNWYLENRKQLGLSIGFLDKALEGRKEEDDGDTLSLASVRSHIFDPYPVPPPSGIQKRIDWIVDTLRIPAREAAVFSTIIRLARYPRFREFYACLEERVSSFGEVDGMMVSRLTGVTVDTIVDMIEGGGVLAQMGLVEDRDANDYAPSQMVLSILESRSTKPDVLASILVGHSSRPSLTLQDFRHLGAEAVRTVGILSGALDAGEKGVGILLHGVPGTGKTEFAKILGRETGAKVVFVGETGEESYEPTRQDRLAHFAFLSALADRAGRIVLVVDEADDIFAGIDDPKSRNRSGSKAYMNRMVETCPVPTIWITNFPDRLGRSVVRRMVHAVEFDEPGSGTRRRIVERQAMTQKFAMKEADIATLSSIPAPPALIESGIRSARLSGGTGSDAVSSVRTLMKALGRHGDLQSQTVSDGFDAALSSADVDLAMLEQSVFRSTTEAMSFLLSGIPGTGKSAFARRLANRLEMDVLEKRGSDLLGKYVGDTEKNIAVSFEEAADRRMFLIFDEVDSLLQKRDGALRNWENSQVNEMLTWMDRHPGPFAATTNNFDNLDVATMRRFLFKVKFGPMDAPRIAEAFRRTFGEEAPVSVLKLDPLVPGDFALVDRKSRVLGTRDVRSLADMLAQEVAAKPGASRSIGF